MIIITPTLGKSLYLPETVKSCKKHAPFARHVLCCPPPECDRLRRLFPHCEVLAEPPTSHGVYTALNASLKATINQTPWISYINDDDALMPGFAQVYEAALQLNGPGILYGEVEMISGDDKLITRVAVARHQWQLGHYFRIGRVPFTQQGTIIATAVLKRIGLFDERYRLIADSDFFHRAFIARVPIHFVKAVSARYRIRPGQLSSDLATQRAELVEMLALYPPATTPWISRAVVTYLGGYANAGVFLERWQLNGQIRMRDLMSIYQAQWD
jgi:glycosyltransferase involved in cell wall biosynthesis